MQIILKDFEEWLTTYEGKWFDFQNGSRLPKEIMLALGKYAESKAVEARLKPVKKKDVPIVK